MYSKPYRFSIERGTDYIHVYLTGRYTEGNEYEQSVDFLTIVADRCRQDKINKIHMVYGIPKELPTIAAFRIARDPDVFGWDYKFILAVTYLNENAFQIGKFIETVAVNRCYNVRAFNNIIEASNWLEMQ